ncbi:hypothetical protein ACU4GR_17330 [Methylobacterium oryzae CBMB20]
MAEDRRSLAASRATFLRLLIPALIALFAVLTLAMWLFVHRALALFRLLQADLLAVHAGTRTRLPEHSPTRSGPRGRPSTGCWTRRSGPWPAPGSAADMAHGLKTPLAVLDALARRTGPADPGLSAEIAEQARAMGGQVERALARPGSPPVAICGGGPAVSPRWRTALSRPCAGCRRAIPSDWAIAVPDTPRLSGGGGGADGGAGQPPRQRPQMGAPAGPGLG